MTGKVGKGNRAGLAKEPGRGDGAIGGGRAWCAVAHVALVAALLAGPGPVRAQEVVASVGAATYDLSGVGTSWVAALRYQHGLPGPLLLEAGTTLFRYETQGADHRTFLMPEVGVGAHLSAGPVAFVLSLGGGVSAPVQGPEEIEPTLFAALAAELPPAGPVAFVPGVRYRAVDPWAGTVFEYTLGVRLRLRP